MIGINGAAAHLVHPGDLVILIAYGQMTTAEARAYEPRVVFVDADNQVVGTGDDPAETFGDGLLLRGDVLAGAGRSLRGCGTTRATPRPTRRRRGSPRPPPAGRRAPTSWSSAPASPG